MGNQPSKDEIQSIAYAATITPDVELGDYVKVGTLTGNITIANPTAPEAGGGVVPAGAKLTFDLTQDGTGSRTVTFGNAFLAAAYTASTTAGRRDVVQFRYDGTNWVLQFATNNVH